jgi:phosphate transport system ATP-binding protein
MDSQLISDGSGKKTPIGDPETIEQQEQLSGDLEGDLEFESQTVQPIEDSTKEEQEEVSVEEKINKLQTVNLDAYYGDFHVLKNIDFTMKENQVTAFIGPSGCGKSTFLRIFNRMNDFIPIFRKNGKVLIDGKDIYDSKTLVEDLRKYVGMVFQKPNPFPKSIFENAVYGLRIQGIKNKAILEEAAFSALEQAALWDEVKDNLNKSALALSGGQQQRLCIARALAVKPTVILMDEPASALDPIATSKIEDLIFELKKDYTIVIVTHNMQQAARVSDNTAFFYIGELIEYNKTDTLFTNPKKELTQNYITGRFG